MLDVPCSVRSVIRGTEDSHTRQAPLTGLPPPRISRELKKLGKISLIKKNIFSSEIKYKNVKFNRFEVSITQFLMQNTKRKHKQTYA